MRRVRIPQIGARRKGIELAQGTAGDDQAESCDRAAKQPSATVSLWLLLRQQNQIDPPAVDINASPPKGSPQPTLKDGSF
jgi:hypothetical protein